MPPQDDKQIQYQALTPRGLRGIWDRVSHWSRAKKIFAAIVLALATGMIMYLVFAAPNQSTLTLDPATTNVSVGQPLVVRIMLDTEDNLVGSVRVVLTFDAAYLSIRDTAITVNGSNASPDATGQYPPNIFPIVPERSVTGNTIAITAGRPGGVSTPTGSPILFATLRFDTIAPSASPVTVVIDQSVSQVLTYSDNPQDILTTVNPPAGGSYSIASAGTLPTTCTALGGVVCPDATLCQVTPITASDVTAPQVCCPESCRSAEVIGITGMQEVISGNTAIISFRTRRGTVPETAGATCTIEYGSAPGSYGSSANATETDTRFPGDYRGTISGLPEGRYYYRVTCPLAASPSPERSFQIGSIAPRLAIGSVGVVNLKSTSADIVWDTNLPASSVVYFGTTSCLNFSTCSGSYTGSSSGPGGSTEHRVSLSSLSALTTYYFRVQSTAGADTVTSSEFEFTTTSGTLEADANVILKVQGDRVCTEWLSCSSGIEIVNDVQEIEDLCFDVGFCRRLDPKTGRCLKPLPSPSAPPSYTVDFANPGNTDINLLARRSGFFKPSVSWTNAGSLPDQVSGTIEGFRHIGQMRQIGEKVIVPNGTFSSSEFGVYPWVPLDASISSLDIAYAARAGNATNQALQSAGSITGTGIAGMLVPLGGGFEVGNEYVVAFDYVVERRKVDADPTGSEGLIVELRHGPNHTIASGQERIDLAPAGSDISRFNRWEHARARLTVTGVQPAQLAQSWLVIGYTGCNAAATCAPPHEYTLKIDNVRIEPVLEVSATGVVEKSCRLYANNTAEECDYIDPATGSNVQGWKGYCLEPDPKNAQNCLLWWPVDILKGESAIFSRDLTAGYAGQFPLYYCLESSGNMNRNKGFSLGGYQVTNLYNQTFVQGGSSGTWIPVPVPIGIGTFVPIRFGATKSCSQFKPDKEYTFGVCKNDMTSMGGFHAWNVPPNAPESNLYEYEIEAVRVNAIYNWGQQYPDELFLTRSKLDSKVVEEHAGVEYRFQRTVDLSTHNITWKVEPSGYVKGKNFLWFSLVFDSRGKLIQYIVNGADDSGDDWEGAAYRVEYILNEPCRYVAQVVSPFGSQKAWVDRFATRTWPEADDNIIGYAYNFENLGESSVRVSSPYGASVAPAGLPPDWPRVLTAEPPDTLLGNAYPYQARLGGPYSVPPRQAVGKVCTEGNRGASCVVDTDCNVTVSAPYCDLERHQCVGGTTISPPGPIVESATCDDIDGDGIFDNTTLGEHADCVGGFDYFDFCVEDTRYCDPTDPDEGIREVVACFLSSHCVGDGGEITGKCEQIPEYKENQDIGSAYCIAGSSEQVGKVCQRSSDCGYSLTGTPGKCVGVNLTSKQISALGGGVAEGVERLQYLFAKSEGVWHYERDIPNDTYRYRLVENLGRCAADPARTCTLDSDCGVADVCQGTTCNALNMEIMPIGTASNACGWDITGARRCSNDPDNACFENSDCAPTDTCSTNYFATPPSVTNVRIDRDYVERDGSGAIKNIRVADQTTYGNGFASVVLLFNSSVNDNQLPLVRYTVDWGDGTVSSVSNLRSQDREDPDKPHTVVHTYLCDETLDPGLRPGWDGGEGACIFKPRIQIEDNWGWCNGVSNDASDLSASVMLRKYSGDGSRCTSWTDYGTATAGRIVVCAAGSCSPNNPPVANAGPDQPVIDADNNGSETVTLSAALSMDPDGDPLSYEWREGASVLGTGIGLTWPFAAGPSHVVTLTVTDARGLSGVDTVIVTVSPPPPNAPPRINGFGNPAGGAAPLTVPFSAGIDDPDGDYPIHSISIDFGDGSPPATFPDMTGPGTITVNHTYNAPGTFTATAHATDSDVAPGTGTAPKTITVTPNNAPVIQSPVVTPASGPAPLSVTLVFDALDPVDSQYPVTGTVDFGDGSPLENYSVPSAAASEISLPHTYSSVAACSGGAVLGECTITITATDAGGAAGAPATLTALVNAVPAAPASLSQEFGGTVEAEGFVANDTTPRFTFTIADQNTGQTIGYHIQLARDAGFTNIVANNNYTWPGSTTNPSTVNFDVLPANALADGQYWWRVQGTDAAGATSNWVTYGTAAADFTINANWWNTAWNYRRLITLSNTGRGALSGFPVLVRLDTSNMTYANALANGADIRFTDTDRNPLPHQIEQWRGLGDISYVWVKVDLPNNASKGIYVYYGNATPGTPPAASEVWSNNFRGVWHLHDTAQDSAPYGANGVDNGGTRVTGRVGDARSFNGTNPAGAHVAIGAPTHPLVGGVLDLPGEVSVFAWMQSTRATRTLLGDMIVGQCRPDGVGGQFGLNLDQPTEREITSTWGDVADCGPAGVFCADTSSSNLSDSQWYYVGFTKSGSPGNWTSRIYVNGSLDETRTNIPFDPDEHGITPSYFQTSIGACGAYPGDYHFQGIIDEVRISNVARSNDWIAAEYASMTGNMQTGVGGEDPRVAYEPLVRIAGARAERSGAAALFNPFRPFLDSLRNILRRPAL